MNLAADLYRYTANVSRSSFVAAYRYKPGFRWTVWFRIVQALRAGGRENRGWVRQALYRLAHWQMWRVGYRFGFDIPASVQIGPGLKLGHFGGVVMQAHVKIGRNCLISHGVTVGRTPRGKRSGTPTIGDRVYVGAGAVIAGGIFVGDEALIAPNAFVNFNVPPRSVVVGNPGRVVSENGVEGYIRNTLP